MNDATLRTGTIENHKRNLRNRIAVLTLRGLNRGLTAEEVRELKELQVKLAKLEVTS